MEKKTIQATNKEILRKRFLEKRRALTKDEVSTSSMSVCKRVLESNWYKAADTVLAYMPIGKEVDILPILKQGLADGKSVYLPKVQGKEMTFYKLEDLDALCSGVFGIPEPKDTTPLPSRKGLMIVPGIVFSKAGFRIGYGGGYYDRYLQRAHQFVTVGVCYKLQLSDAIFPDVFDKQLDFVIAENEVYSH